MIKRLYRVLDESIILGKNQMLIMNTGEEFVSSQDNDYSYLQKLESMIKSRQYDSLKKTVRELLYTWGEEQRKMCIRDRPDGGSWMGCDTLYYSGHY